MDYWVADLTNRTVWVHREPSRRGYFEVTQHQLGETISPLGALEVAIAVADLLPRPAAATPTPLPSE